MNTPPQACLAVCTTGQTDLSRKGYSFSTEVSIVWIVVIGLAIGAIGISGLRSRVRHDADLGWMSQRWLTEHWRGSR